MLSSYLNQLLIRSHPTSQPNTNSLLTDSLDKPPYNRKAHLSIEQLISNNHSIYHISTKKLKHTHTQTQSQTHSLTSASKRALLISRIGSTIFSLVKTSEAKGIHLDKLYKTHVPMCIIHLFMSLK